ncbi:hypothetical protein QVD17_28621 [Tagetes erecta]|uniref:Uncharacterized protein n=1 Tax=Tagetes erecta TaxID=13708 RepID=A0AAD8KD71_TARER|nr:hypothetical protein QVD17_28621 [Tagetes erecta]
MAEEGVQGGSSSQDHMKVYKEDVNEHVESAVEDQGDTYEALFGEGDANTKYFHNILKCKNNKKMIYSVLRPDAMVLEGESMVKEFVNFYEIFLGGEHDQPSFPSGRLQLVRSDLSSMHIFWAAAFIIPVYTAKEIEESLASHVGDFYGEAKMIKKLLPKCHGRKSAFPCWRVA